VALTVALFSASLAWRAAATEETVASPGEIVPESDNLRDASGHIADIPVVPLADAVTTADGIARTLSILGTNIYPNSSQRFSWAATELFEGVPVSTPVLVGPTLCLTAAVHGDELNGIEMVRRVMHDLNSEKLSGAVLGVPIVNLQGFRRAYRS
jgi:predicted deacylase